MSLSPDKWLVLDTTYLCYRAFHAMGGLKYGTMKTGVAYGVLRDVHRLQRQHNANRVAFCFDSRHSKRRERYADYKQNRRNNREENPEVWDDLFMQIRLLRTKWLPQVGFRNIFHQRGYEADDLVAQACEQLRPSADCIIVGSDADLLQCLRRGYRGETRGGVFMWDIKGKRLRTADQFRLSNDMHPEDWALVKAIAGCSGDNVPGIKGVGETYASQFIRGQLKRKTKAYQAIIAGRHIIQRNLPLVQLPYEGVEPLQFREDEVTKAKWRELADTLGMRSIRELLK